MRGGEGVGTAKSVGHCAVARPTWEYARACGGVRGDFGPARPSSCTLTSIDQRRAREVYSERQVLKGTHSGAEGSGRVVLSLLSRLYRSNFVEQNKTAAQFHLEINHHYYKSHHHILQYYISIYIFSIIYFTVFRPRVVLSGSTGSINRYISLSVVCNYRF